MVKLGVKIKDVKVIQVPNYDNLTITKMISWAAE